MASVLGGSAQQSVIGALTWVDLATAGIYLLAAALVSGAVSFFIRRRAPRREPAPADARDLQHHMLTAARKPVHIRVLATAADSSKSFDLRCEIREKFIAYIQRHNAESLPRYRGRIELPAASRGAGSR